jgi:hypothetical protein
MKRTIYYGFEDPFEMPNGSKVVMLRVTVGTLNVQENGEQAKLRNLYRLRAEELTGKKWSTLENFEEDVPAEIRTKFVLWNSWSYMRTSLRKLEVQLEGADDGDYIEIDLGTIGWDSLAGLDTMPLDLFTVWAQKAQVVNPGFFGNVVDDGEGDTEKKVGVIPAKSVALKSI